MLFEAFNQYRGRYISKRVEEKKQISYDWSLFVCLFACLFVSVQCAAIT